MIRCSIQEEIQDNFCNLRNIIDAEIKEQEWRFKKWKNVCIRKCVNMKVCNRNKIWFITYLAIVLSLYFCCVNFLINILVINEKSWHCVVSQKHIESPASGARESYGWIKLMSIVPQSDSLEGQ